MDKGVYTKAADTAEFHRQAEELLRAKITETRLPLTEAESQRLIHELEVHRIELEMQNAELRKARDDAETALGKYSDLYDFAPVGYFTLNRDGGIREANLTGANLVGIERSRLIGQSFEILIGDEERSQFADFIGRLFAGWGKVTCEVKLQGKKEQPIFVRIEAVSTRRIARSCQGS